MFEVSEVDGLDLAGCADALAGSVVAARRVGAERLALVAHFADLHGPGSSSGRFVRMVAGGSDGTPEVSEFAADGLGPLLEVSTHAAAGLLRDVLDLRHRHPRLWEAVMTGRVEEWKARKVAQACTDLSQEAARWVDGVTLEAVLGLPFGRALSVVEGKVVAADPAGHDARRRARESQRFVRASRSDPAGLRMLHARTTAGDVARLEAMVAHLADLLARSGDPHDLQHRRATALGLLANPALACVLLAGALQPATSPPPDEPGSADVAAEPEATDPELVESVEDVEPVEDGEPVEPVEPAGAVAAAQVLRSEGLGAVTRTQLQEWLGTDQVVVRPVIDLHGQEPADAYEIPSHLREAMILTQPYEVFPYGTTASRAPSIDADHTRPWTPPHRGGPPGQTALDNLGPLARGHHRAKTFGGFTCHQPLPGLYLWRTPTGHWYRVDHTGTTPLGTTTPDIVRQTRPPTRRATHVDWAPGEHHLRTLVERPAA